jgi:hypothetical protein
VRLYTVMTGKNERAYVACRKRTGGRTVITTIFTFGGETFIAGFRVRGLNVALERSSAGPDYIEDSLIWGRAGAREHFREVSAYTSYADPQPEGSATIGAWFLSRTGNVAFLSTYQDRMQVVLGDVGGNPRTLDESLQDNGIGPGSLALAVDDTLYWTHGTEARSARVPAPAS